MLHPIVQSLFISLLGRRILQLNPWQTTLWSIVGIFFAIAVGYLSLCMLEEPARRILSRPCKGNAGKTE
jgi:peptidoglycan/LPS O-acetylase OafA/YrhL